MATQKEIKEPAAYLEFRIEANRDSSQLRSDVVFGGQGRWISDSWLHHLRAFAATALPAKDNVWLFAPLDLPNGRTVGDLLALYRLYSIPDEFVSERLHHVAHSFGTSEEMDGSSCSWFHFLCKNVAVQDINGVKSIVNQNRRDDKDLSQAEFSWGSSPQLTLIVFGGEIALWENFDSLASKTSGQDIIDDPFCLLGTVFEVLYNRLDKIAWDLARVYSQEEENILLSADHPGSAADALDFVGLHMLSKHQIYLIEVADAAMATLDSLTAHHERLLKSYAPASEFAFRRTQDTFYHRRTNLKSTNLRLKSLEKRTQNIINLSFNLVTQADSRIMKADSSSMKIIAVMTLVFLPCTAVATIFSTPFFYLMGESEDTGPLRMSP
ncbi:hypothetical protein DL95DRAFT_460087 [Leptodontidium sp. 2 PMI_412]|nr:hypothetical protein DL95DRAFT_460087 [Leptodontidium sp. 2 PMI_412]